LKGIWHPEDFGYPDDYTIGKLKQEDWRTLLKYFEKCPEFPALKTAFD